MEHREGWPDSEPSEQKQAVQMIQIDRILHGVIRERMFGDLINRKESLLEGNSYGDITNTTLNSFRNWSTSHRRRFTAYSSTRQPIKPTTTMNSFRCRDLQTSKTLDKDMRRRVIRTAAEVMPKKKHKLSFFEKKLMKMTQHPLPHLKLNNNASFQEFFRKMANVPPKGILVEGKISR